MTDVQRDMWAQWLLNRRFGGDPELMKKMFDFLYPVRDKVLSHVDLKENETLLNAGSGGTAPARPGRHEHGINGPALDPDVPTGDLCHPGSEAPIAGGRESQSRGPARGFK